MPKGIFTQTFCLLTDGTTLVSAIRGVLQAANFKIIKETPASKDLSFGGPTLVIPFREELNGYIAVDVVNEPWPDAMGDPKSDAITFGAWTMGQFGPFTFPGGLARAVEHSWGWREARQVIPTHRGFIRMRLSYAFGAGPDAPGMPAGIEPLPELLFLDRLTIAALRVPGVLCYFNPTERS